MANAEYFESDSDDCSINSDFSDTCDAVTDLELDQLELDDPITEDDRREYCTCGLPSNEFMIWCDDGNCEIQWYHYQCVGLTEATVPKGKWFCDLCHDQSGKCFH